MPTRESLGPLELAVLRHIADHYPLTVRDVARHFAEHSGLARTTLQTIMERLRAKGYLTRHKVEGVHHYRPKTSKANLLHGLVHDFVEEVLDGSASPFIAYLARASRLTRGEVRNLERILDRLGKLEGKQDK
jgi:predicted transcriptional regulator